MVEGMDHIGVAVRNTDESLPYYLDRLGFTLTHDERLPEAGVRLTYLSTGDTVIQLVQPLGEGPVQQFLEERSEGLHHICFAVQDIVEARQRLEGGTQAEIFVGGRNRRSCNLFSHPNGLNIELCELEPYQQRATVSADHSDGKTHESA